MWWKKIPLNVKLILSLVTVHVVFFAVAADGLIAWNRAKRLNELNHRLDAQGDFIEDVIALQGGRLIPNPDSEMRRELDYDRDTYFFVTDGEGIVDESRGPPAEVIRLLKTQLEPMTLDSNEGFLIAVGDEHWLAQLEVVERRLPNATLQVMSHIAIRAQPTLDEIARFRQVVVVCAMLLTLAISIATGIVVAYSTRNLRRFAQNLRTHNPMQETCAFAFTPRSFEEHQLHESYQAMSARVRKNAESQRLFIAHASHELKSPLATALAVTQFVLSRPRSRQEYEEAHREVFDVLTVLRRLSTALLDFSSLEETTFDATRGGTSDIRDVLAMVVQRWEADAARKRIRIEAAPLPRRLIPGRPELWETVFGNLLDNAIKYGKADGHVRLTWKQEDVHLLITIADDGIGMSPADLSRLGEVFFRADVARTRAGSFGLGFAHARRICEWLGGTLTIESQLAVGTTAVVTIPQKAQPSLN